MFVQPKFSTSTSKRKQANQLTEEKDNTEFHGVTPASIIEKLQLNFSHSDINGNMQIILTAFDSQGDSCIIDKIQLWKL